MPPHPATPRRLSRRTASAAALGTIAAPLLTVVAVNGLGADRLGSLAYGPAPSDAPPSNESTETAAAVQPDAVLADLEAMVVQVEAAGPAPAIAEVTNVAAHAPESNASTSDPVEAAARAPQPAPAPEAEAAAPVEPAEAAEPAADQPDAAPPEDPDAPAETPPAGDDPDDASDSFVIALLRDSLGDRVTLGSR